MIHWVFLLAFFLMAGCQSGSKIENFDNTQKRIECKNEQGNVTLQAKIQSAEALENGNYRVKDMNGSFIITKGKCKITGSEGHGPEKHEDKPATESTKKPE